MPPRAPERVSFTIVKSQENYKAGFVSVVGGPNVGKSTLVNALVGQKICATSRKPNTTRNRINGIFTDPEAQIVFMDTPGIVRPVGELREKMVSAALGTLGEGITLAVTDASAPFRRGEVKAIEESPRPAIVALNKTDLVSRKATLEAMEKSAGFKDKISDIVPISALKDKGLDRLVEVLKKYLPEGKKIFPEQIFTDQPEKFVAAEFVREKIFRLTRGEVPYESAVVVRELRDGKGGTVYIRADVFLEKEGHRKILIGSGGGMIKKIGSHARGDIEKILGAKVFLELNVLVKPGWSKDRGFIDEIYEG